MDKRKLSHSLHHKLLPQEGHTGHGVGQLRCCQGCQDAAFQRRGVESSRSREVWSISIGVYREEKRREEKEGVSICM